MKCKVRQEGWFRYAEFSTIVDGYVERVCLFICCNIWEFLYSRMNIRIIFLYSNYNVIIYLDCMYGKAIFMFTIILILTGTTILYRANIANILFKPFSPVFPSPNRYFVGRSQDVSTILEWLDFSSNISKDIVNIVGPPGIGKSALAKYAGNEVITRGESAYYINMAEFPNEQLKQVLAAKIFSLWNRESNLTRISFDRLHHWADSLWFNTVIILDNCDDCIQNQLEAFHEAINDLLEFSRRKLKIITSSREFLMHLENNAATFKVQPLDEDSACLLLENKVPNLLNFSEKKTIADLTGKVPLALQIIGALLSAGINPPTPSEIITNLKNWPIYALSPTGLHRNMNASISLSYNFLDQTTQRIGYYLTLFPGSFDKETAVGVLSRICTDDVHQTLNSLIARSLLEFDDSNGRCSYHRLIKSFFMTKEHPLQLKDFFLAFQHFYAKRIQKLVNEYYCSSPGKALVILNLEQHNILYFVKLLQNKLYLYQPEDYARFVTTYTYVFLSGYLHLRLSSKKMVEVTNAVLDSIEKYIHDHQNSLQFPDFFKSYVDLATGLCIESYHKDMESTLNECKKRIPFVEKVKHLPGTTAEYVHFYYHILSFRELVDEQTSKLYYARLLRKIDKSSLNCKVSTSDTTCEFYDFALGYYYLDKHEKSAKFLEKVLENNPSSLVCLKYLVMLHVSYTRLGNTSKETEVKGKLLDSFDAIIDQPSYVVQIYLHNYVSYLTTLRLIGEAEKAIAVYEKIFDSIKELVSCELHHDGAVMMLDMIEDLLELKEFEKVVKFANYFLKCIDFLNHQEYLVLSLRKNKALYLIGKLAEAQNNFQDMMKYIIKHNLTESYSQVYGDVCYYLFMSRNFDYLLECYYDKVINSFSSGLIYPIIVTIYDLYSEDSSPSIVREQPIDNYPPLMELSKEKGLSHDDINEGRLSRATHTSYFRLGTATSAHFKLFLTSLTNNNAFRFLANFLSIIVRLLLCFYLCRVILRCIKITLSICYLLFFSLYFTLLIVLAYCYTYFEKYIF